MTRRVGIDSCEFSYVPAPSLLDSFRELANSRPRRSALLPGKIGGESLCGAAVRRGGRGPPRGREAFRKAT